MARAGSQFSRRVNPRAGDDTIQEGEKKKIKKHRLRDQVSRGHKQLRLVLAMSVARVLIR